MKAAFYEGKKSIYIKEIEKPIPKENEVLIKVKYAGICGSDLELYRTGLHPSKIVLGHEVVGYIVEKGSEVSKSWKINDRASIDCTINCGECFYCKRGEMNLCTNAKAVGLGVNGGFAEYLTCPESCLVSIPDNVPDRHGTVFDPIASGLLALEKSEFVPGSSAVVLGLGSIGQFMLQCLKLAGARTIAVVEKNPHRLEVAKKFEPDVALDKLKFAKIRRSNKQDVSGLDFVFECSGVPTLVNAAIDLVRKGGTVAQIGLWHEPISINELKYVLNQITIKGIMGFKRDNFEFAVDLVSQKKIDPDPIVTSIISLDDIVEEGFERGIDPDTKDIKILVEP
ncbi:MAG: alcohol dehydrogenase catalytic domain-containing protein [Candidatus Lokiarchaeota archaeon]|nr:alcohol dehydrogenase catalytic domain-containing protein [Candidatus Lokiarchaeota archaeon]MBD3343323.1 alcohol dehydrogenase catalytic domain-containing protein [Candidatus Lokiarchaeota archaeon]